MPIHIVVSCRHSSKRILHPDDAKRVLGLFATLPESHVPPTVAVKPAYVVTVKVVVSP